MGAASLSGFENLPANITKKREHSVHTSEEALRRGKAEIERIGDELRANGTLRR
jgi:hypothetical protein